MGNVIYKGITQMSAIPMPLMIFLFSPRKENISFGFITMAVKMNTEAVRSSALIDCANAVLRAMLRKSVTSTVFLHTKCTIMLAEMAYIIFAVFELMEIMMIGFIVSVRLMATSFHYVKHLVFRFYQTYE